LHHALLDFLGLGEFFLQRGDFGVYVGEDGGDSCLFLRRRNLDGYASEFSQRDDISCSAAVAERLSLIEKLAGFESVSPETQVPRFF
jgi:hypothetical protein